MKNVQVCVGKKHFYGASDSPQIPAFPRWSRGSRTRVASQTRHSAAQKYKHMNLITRGTKCCAKHAPSSKATGN